jgi:hypothetical protein
MSPLHALDLIDKSSLTLVDLRGREGSWKMIQSVQALATRS